MKQNSPIRDAWISVIGGLLLAWFALLLLEAVARSIVKP